MVQIFCAVVGERASAFAVRVDERDTVFDLKKAIHGELRCDATARELQLFLAKKDGAWLIGEQIQDIQDGDGLSPLQVVQRTLRSVGLSDADVNRMADDEEAAAKGPVHVLVVVPTIVVQERAQKKAKLSTSHFTHKDMMAIASSLDIDAWGVGGVSLDLRFVEPDFPTWIYARQEMLDLFKIFKAEEQAMVFVGSPGVGKSMLVVLLAFYKALHQNKRVVLFRRLKQAGCSMLYLDAGNRNYWRKERTSLHDIAYELRALEEVVESVELCLDGLKYDDIRHHVDTVGQFRLLATSAQYPFDDDDIDVLQRYLVPFWSFPDLTAVGAHRNWNQLEIEKRYFDSGGNLRHFVSAAKSVKLSIDGAIQRVSVPVADLLKTQYGSGSEQQIDRIRMATISLYDRAYLAKVMTEQRILLKYSNCSDWVYKISSEYAMRQLGTITKPSYYEDLWANGKLIDDDSLMGIAFENYVHMSARNGTKMMLKIREYDRAKVKGRPHVYDTLEFESKSCRYHGKDEDECKEAMEEFARSDTDYWYPACRSLATIDCVAKVKIDGQDVVGLIQITKSEEHHIDSDVVDEYAKLYPGGCCYIALVPDKKTCDVFRLKRADPATQMPLHVAYLTNWTLST